jgi:hypothetical protein
VKYPEKEKCRLPGFVNKSMTPSGTPVSDAIKKLISGKIIKKAKIIKIKK